MLLIVTEPLLAVIVPPAVELTPGLVVDVVWVEVAVKLILPVVELNAELR